MTAMDNPSVTLGERALGSRVVAAIIDIVILVVGGGLLALLTGVVSPPTREAGERTP
ncbi:MAG: hypothetical protein ACRDHF_09965 [Tepidiformaceae bacterium]